MIYNLLSFLLISNFKKKCIPLYCDSPFGLIESKLIINEIKCFYEYFSSTKKGTVEKKVWEPLI